ncbi:MAG: glycosyltransferase [Deltaproteobacteria bacterium]|nr:glycosyltransferase [Deltaproteobacteria bacterium]
MSSLAVIVFESRNARISAALLETLCASPLVGTILLVGDQEPDLELPDICRSVVEPNPQGGRCIEGLVACVRPCEYALIITAPEAVQITTAEIEAYYAAAVQTEAGMCYADFFALERSDKAVRPLTCYQSGSIRDDFFFGCAYVLSLSRCRKALERFGALRETVCSGLYELRLKISRCALVVRIERPLYCVGKTDAGKAGHFDYVGRDHLAVQADMEAVATEHLKGIGAYCAHPFLPVYASRQGYPVDVSVVIPVRNRERTIGDAVKSALSQQTDFTFNVLVVQNHSTDRTGRVLEEIARTDGRLVQIVPAQMDLGIGGCWNEAVCSAQCGRFVCQLDSDDLYKDEHSLAAMLAPLRSGEYGMAVGAYRLVDFDLQEIPPGIVDHREWTDGNGRNNLLRVQGIGAPRAFVTELVRRYPFPNVSYGEDYAVALRITRDYRVARLYEPVYLCRRWEENSDAGLSAEQENRYAEFKDGLRTSEIEERIAYNNQIRKNIY